MVLNHVESCSIIITIVNVILKINSRRLRIFYRLFATSCSEMRIIMSNIIKRTKGDLKYLFKDSDKLSPKALKRKQRRKMLKTVR